MTAEVIPTVDLLSAYLIGDATQDERTAVEQWLAADIAARELLGELRELCVLLNVCDSIASPKMLDALRRNVQKKIDEHRIKTLVAISVTGDLTANEKSEVQTYLNAHPSEVSTQRQIAATTLLLASGQRSATTAQVDRLRQMVASKLPAGALAPKVSVPKIKASTPAANAEYVSLVEMGATAAPTSQSGRVLERPSLRVFVLHDYRWKKRAWAIGGIAALIALSVGTRALMNRYENAKQSNVALPGKVNPTIQAEPANTEPKINNAIEKVQNAPIVKQDAAPIAPRELIATPNPVAPNVAVEKTPATPPQSPTTEPNLVNPGVAPKVANDTHDRTQIQDAPKSSDNATSKKDVPSADIPQAPVKPPLAPNLTNGSFVAQNTPTNPNMNTSSQNGGGGMPIVTPGVTGTGNIPIPAPQNGVGLAPTQGGTTIPPQDGVGVAGVIKGAGTVQVTSATGVVTILKNTGDTVSSGSRIVTDDARVSLVLPGNGRLYVARFSNLKVSFMKSSTTVELNGGEVYYIAPNGGSMTLTAVNASATRIVEGDVSLAAGKLTALNFNNAALDLAASKQGSLHVANGFEASVSVDGNSAVKRDPTLTLNGLWRTDVLVPGDGIKALKSRK